MVGFPYTSWIAIAGLIITIATMPLIPGQGSGLYVGLLLTGLYLMLYIVFRTVPQKWLNRNNALAKPLPRILKPEQQNLDREEKKLK
jgi:AAT family amino acid transporter